MLLVAMPISLFNIVSMPVIARLHSGGDRRNLRRLLGTTSAGMTMGALSLCVPFLVAGDQVLSAVFGREFTTATLPLLVLSLSVVVNAMFGAAANLLNMTGYQNDVTRASLVSLLCLAAIAVPLTHYLGILGAAIAHLVSTIVWNLYLWFVAKVRLSLDSSILSLLSVRPSPGA